MAASWTATVSSEWERTRPSTRAAPDTLSSDTAEIVDSASRLSCESVSVMPFATAFDEPLTCDDFTCSSRTRFSNCGDLGNALNG